jgi:FkbM family methyltransferase
MAAHTDFDYLHSLAVSSHDHDTLERIRRDRETLLYGGTLPESGERLSLSLLDPDAAARTATPGQAAPGMSGRAAEASLRADAAAPRQTAAEVPWRAAPPTPEGTLRLTLRSDLAPASLDTLLEIFRDHAHARAEGFRPDDLDGSDGAGVGPMVVDLGANEGFYTLRMKRRNPALRIVAVEAVAVNIDLFRENLAANGLHGVETLCAAVVDPDGAREGVLELETYPHVGTIASRDLTGFPRPWIRPERIRTERVPAVSLSEVLRRYRIEEAALLKVDIEGSEVDALSAEPSELRRFERIVVECHGKAARERCTAMLDAAGFDLLAAEEKRSGDCYFRRRGE